MINPYDGEFDLLDEILHPFGGTKHDKWLEFEILKCYIEELKR